MSTPVAMPRGPVMFDIAGLTLSAEDRERLLHPAAGGIILFAENFESKEQLTKLVQAIKSVRDPALIVAVDQEGGRVQRFKDGFAKLPPARAYGTAFDESMNLGRDLAWVGGWAMASELRSTGVDISFAPVLDVDLANSSVIGDRSFHSDPGAVTVLASSFVDGMAHAGMVATGKHFPGHGGVTADSHEELPIETRDRKVLELCDLRPFESLIRTDRLAAIMTAHVKYERVDEHAPTFSSKWLKDELRERLGFKGIVFSDDLHMQGAATVGSPVQRAQAALDAGCDVPLICRDKAAADQILDHVAKAGGALADPMAGLAAGSARIHPKDDPDMSDAWDRALEALALLKS